MSSVKDSFLQNPDKYRQLVWDYKIPPETFFSILEGKEERGWFTQDWAIARVLEHANYYDARALVPLSLLKERWHLVAQKLFHSSVRKGYEYVLHRYAVPATR